MDKIKQPHYQFSSEMTKRYKTDEISKGKSFKSRANTFELLEDFSPLLENPSLVSSSTGSITRILLTAPSYVLKYKAYSDVYEDLILKLPSSTKFIILSHSSTKPELELLLDRSNAMTRSQIIEVPDSMKFSVWAEDAYAVTQNNGTETPNLVEPASFPRLEDALIADIISNQTDLGHYHASLYYQGGNILIGDDFWIIGADYPNKSLNIGMITPEPNETKLEAVKRLYSASLDKDRKMIILGSSIPVPSAHERKIKINGQEWTEEVYAGNDSDTSQPMFHIDMFVTLAGRNSNGQPIALVGDPEMASKILNEPLEKHSMANIYNDIANKLKSNGFEIIRNPLPLVYQDDQRERFRSWYFATSNNALVEVDGTNKKVWFPTYGYGVWSNLTATDNENKRIWEELGFEVNMLGDFHPFAYNLGAAHCITKFINRNKVDNIV